MPSYQFMERAIPVLPPARRFVATDVPCPSCRAEIAVPCAGDRVCPERMHAALDLVRAGRLPEAPEAGADVQDDDGSTSNCAGVVCGEEHTARGTPVACPRHRCQWILSKRRCRSIRVPGSVFCGPHTAGKRWN